MTLRASGSSVLDCTLTPPPWLWSCSVHRCTKGRLCCRWPSLRNRVDLSWGVLRSINVACFPYVVVIPGNNPNNIRMALPVSSVDANTGVHRLMILPRMDSFRERTTHFRLWNRHHCGGPPASLRYQIDSSLRPRFLFRPWLCSALLISENSWSMCPAASVFDNDYWPTVSCRLRCTTLA